jgi:hypothetical protein
VNLVASALKNDYRETRDRVLLLLSFVHPSPTWLNARALLRSGSDSQRANALETIDNLIAGPRKTTVLALFDDVPDSERLARLQRRHPQSARTRVDRLRELLTISGHGVSNWCRACAVYEGARFGESELLDVWQSATHHPDALVRETAEALSGVVQAGCAAEGDHRC